MTAQIEILLQTLVEGQHQTNQHIEAMNASILVGFKQVEQRLDRIEQRLDRVEQRLDVVERHLAELDQRLVAVEQHLVHIDARLDAMDQRFDAMDQRLEAMEQRARNRHEFNRAQRVQLSQRIRDYTSAVMRGLTESAQRDLDLERRIEARVEALEARLDRFEERQPPLSDL